MNEMMLEMELDEEMEMMCRGSERLHKKHRKANVPYDNPKREEPVFLPGIEPQGECQQKTA